jgi:hypothetical protein
MTIRIDAVKVMISITTPFPMNFVHWSYAIHKVLYHGNFGKTDPGWLPGS